MDLNNYNLPILNNDTEVDIQYSFRNKRMTNAVQGLTIC
jgi:hypothetical protein